MAKIVNTAREKICQRALQEAIQCKFGMKIPTFNSLRWEFLVINFLVGPFFRKRAVIAKQARRDILNVLFNFLHYFQLLLSKHIKEKASCEAFSMCGHKRK